MNQFETQTIMVEGTLPVVGIKIRGPYEYSSEGRVLDAAVLENLNQQRRWFILNTKEMHVQHKPSIVFQLNYLSRKAEFELYGRFMILADEQMRGDLRCFDEGKQLRFIRLDDDDNKGNPTEVGSLLAPAVILLLLGRYRQSAKKDMTIEMRLMTLILHYRRILDPHLIAEIGKDFALFATARGETTIHPRT